jgi:hypothetical protein
MIAIIKKYFGRKSIVGLKKNILLILNNRVVSGSYS